MFESSKFVDVVDLHIRTYHHKTIIHVCKNFHVAQYFIYSHKKHMLDNDFLKISCVISIYA